MRQKGEKIGNYSIERFIGKGNFGEVYLATKSTVLNFRRENVAIKILNQKKLVLEAVRKEVEIWQKASSQNHPNILPINDADDYPVDKDKHEYLIESKYIANGSVKDLLEKEGKLQPEKAVKIMIGVLNGLSFLHSLTPKKIIHRDLKPENILLDAEVPLIADFGISRDLQPGDPTRSSHFSGTPSYAALEAFAGKRDEQTDIWSAGVVLYEVLTGNKAFPTEDREDWYLTLLKKIEENNPQPIPEDVPPKLREVVAKAMSTDRTNRYKTAGEMLAALESIFVEKDTILDEEFIDDSAVREVEREAQYELLQAEAEAKVADLRKQLEEANSKAEEARLNRELEKAKLARLEQETKKLVEDIEFYRRVVLYEDDYVVGRFDVLSNLIGEEKFGELTRNFEAERDALNAERARNYQDKAKNDQERSAREREQAIEIEGLRKAAEDLKRQIIANDEERDRGRRVEEQKGKPSPSPLRNIYVTKEKKGLGLMTWGIVGFVFIVLLALFWQTKMISNSLSNSAANVVQGPNFNQNASAINSSNNNIDRSKTVIQRASPTIEPSVTPALDNRSAITLNPTPLTKTKINDAPTLDDPQTTRPQTKLPKPQLVRPKQTIKAPCRENDLDCLLRKSREQ